MHIEHIRERLATHRPASLAANGDARAAVALILRDGERGVEFVAIRRSERAGDPWSGHMALPGGRQHAADADLLATAARETREEVGIDLGAHGHTLGRLDELRAYGGGRPMGLIISPFVFALTASVDLVLNKREVDAAVWVPLAVLREPGAQGNVRYVLAGQQTEHSAFVYQGYSIWGLTYRILSGFLDVV